MLLILPVCLYALEWTPGPKLPYSVLNAAAVTAQGRIYILGGSSGGVDSSNIIDTIMSAPLNPDGSIGEFKIHSAKLPIPLAGQGAGVIDGQIYIYGGYNNNNYTVTGQCWVIPIQPDGELGAPVPASSGLPKEGAYQLADGFGRCNMAFKNRLYIIGGEGQTRADNYPNLNMAYMNSPSGGNFGPSWTPMQQRNPVISDAQQYPGVWNPSVAFYQGKAKDYAFQIGGCPHPNPGTFRAEGTTNKVAVAAINPATGMFDSWRLSNPLPVSKQCGTALCVKNQIFVIGGTATGAAMDNKVYVGTIQEDTGDISWQIDAALYPVQTRAPVGVTWEGSDGSIYIGVFGGHEGSALQSMYAKAYDPRTGAVTVSAPAEVAGAVAVTTMSPQEQPATIDYPQYPGLLPGFHSFDEARKAIAGPPPKTHAIYFMSPKSRKCSNQSFLLQDDSFLSMTRDIIFVQINTLDYHDLAGQIGVYRTPTWVFYDASGKEKGRVVDAMTPEQIHEMTVKIR